LPNPSIDFRLLEHASLAIASGVYAHLMPRQADEETDIAGSIFQPAIEALGAER
jgi:hypothetical protein